MVQLIVKLIVLVHVRYLHVCFSAMIWRILVLVKEKGGRSLFSE